MSNSQPAVPTEGEMTVPGVKVLRVNLEQDIQRLIDTFTDRSDVFVQEIKVKPWCTVGTNGATMSSCRVRVEVGMPRADWEALGDLDDWNED